VNSRTSAIGLIPAISVTGSWRTVYDRKPAWVVRYTRGHELALTVLPKAIDEQYTPRISALLALGKSAPVTAPYKC
jgi:hypothetical protein